MKLCPLIYQYFESPRTKQCDFYTAHRQTDAQCAKESKSWPKLKFFYFYKMRVAKESSLSFMTIRMSCILSNKQRVLVAPVQKGTLTTQILAVDFLIIFTATI